MTGYLLNFVAWASVLIIVVLAVVCGVRRLRGWLSRQPLHRRPCRTAGLSSGRYLVPPGGSWMHPIRTK